MVHVCEHVMLTSHCDVILTFLPWYSLYCVQIVAEYEEHTGPSAPQGGYGTSGSSVGSASPDVFQSNRKLISSSNIPAGSTKSGITVKASAGVPTNPIRSSPALYIDTTASNDSG